MAQDLGIRLVGGPSTFTFDIDGDLLIRKTPSFKFAANPPELESMEEAWEITGALLVGTGSAPPVDVLTEYTTFLLAWQDRNPWVRAELISDPTGTPVVQQTLGPSAYQGFRVESVVVGDIPTPEALEAGNWRVAIPIDITVAADRLFPDGNGIVGWDQRVSNQYENALHRLEWETTIKVEEGAVSSALDLAKTHALIPISTFGNTYVWDTNGPDGIDFVFPDADESNSRTPTNIIATSRIRQFGITIGTPSAGNAVNGPLTFQRETIVDGTAITTITRASAEGPGALNWVQSKKPSGILSFQREFEDQANRRAEGEWRVVGPPDESVPGSLLQDQVRMTLSGGSQSFSWVPISGGKKLPRLVVGGLNPMRLDANVIVRSEGPGVDPKTLEFNFDIPAGSPWVLDQQLSSEDAIAARVNDDPARPVWERSANLVYWLQDPSKCERDVLKLALTPPRTVESYLCTGDITLFSPI